MILHDSDESALPLNCSLFILLLKRPPLLWPEMFQFKRKSMCHTWRTCRPYREGLPDPNSIWDQKNKYDQRNMPTRTREAYKACLIHTHTRIVQIHAQIHATVEKERDRQTSRPGGPGWQRTRRSTKRTEKDYEYCRITELLDFHWS